MENLCNAMREYGATFNEMCNAISNLPKIPFTEMDIVLIKNNPSLSWFQKWRLIKRIRENMTID